MAFLNFPVYFTDSDEDAEKLENLGLKPTTTEGEIVINTNMICAYNEMDNGMVMVRLANGDCVEAPIDIDTFEEVLSQVEHIIDLKQISQN
jgi:hypothetical protein